MIPCIFVTNETSFSIDLDIIRTLSQHVLKLLGLSAFELSITFVTSDEIHALNHQYRGKDSATDVLSFPLLEWEKPVLFADKERTRQGEMCESLGDIVIAPEIAQKNAEDIGQSLAREVAFLIVHSILHLAGHDHIDREEEKLMLAQQKQVMAILDEKKIWNLLMKQDEYV